jgi:hypothetical protein
MQASNQGSTMTAIGRPYLNRSRHYSDTAAHRRSDVRRCIQDGGVPRVAANMRRQSPGSEVHAHIIAWQKSNPRPLGSGTQSQDSVRHITFLALKIMAVWQYYSDKDARIPTADKPDF